MSNELMADINQAIDCHAFNDFEFFGGARPMPTLVDIKRDFDLKQFEGDSWGDFLFVNDIYLEDA